MSLAAAPDGATPPAPPAPGPEFDLIARIAREEAGLVIPAEKAPMVFARLTKRLRRLGLPDLQAYCARLTGPDATAERRELICTLTTNVTSFFREAHHMEWFAREILPELGRRLAAGGRVRLWSAGCSSGQEPYSLAMTVLSALPGIAGRDLRILATDIDPHILAQARDGRYPASALEKLPPGHRERFFSALPPDGPGERLYEVGPALRAMIVFRELNLLAHWPMRGRFDAIFCRNVVIYFDQETQRSLWPRFEAACAPGGHLFLGHSERIDPVAMGGFRPVFTTTYRRGAEPGARSAASRG